MYRKEARAVRKEVNWTVWNFLPLFLMVIVILFGVVFGLKSLGILGVTVVERKVFENSYQRSEAIKSQIAIDEAQLAEIERKLINPSLDESTIINLEAQRSAINVRIAAARGMQQ